MMPSQQATSLILRLMPPYIIGHFKKTLDRSITGAQQDWGAAAMPEPLILHRRWFEVNTNISTLSLIMTMLSCQMFAS